MSQPRKQYLKLAVKLAVCALLMVWIFHQIFTIEAENHAKASGFAWEELSRTEQWREAWTQGPKALWDTMRAVSPGAFTLSLAFMGSTLLVGAARWRMILGAQGLDLPFWRVLEISLVAHFFNSFLLGSTGGDLLKAYYAARETHHKKAEAVTTVFADRLIGLFSMLILAAALMIPNWRLFQDNASMAAIAVLILGMLTVCGVMMQLAFGRDSRRSDSLLRGLLRRAPNGALLERSLDSCKTVGRTPGLIGRTVGLSMALNALCILQFAAVAIGLDLAVPPLAFAMIVPTLICISALPVTPSGLGLRENISVLMFTIPALGAPSKLALSLSLLAYAGFLVWSLIGGFFYLTLKDSMRLDDLTEAAR